MVGRRKNEPEYFTCPHCGASVRVGAPSCRECGSDAETGWSQDAHLWEADIPPAEGDDDDFDYDEFVSREFPGHANTSAGHMIRTWATGVLVAIVCLAFLFWSLTR